MSPCIADARIHNFNGEKNARNYRRNSARPLAFGPCYLIHDGRAYSWPTGYRNRDYSDSRYSRATYLTTLKECPAVHSAY
jgi:hypothetical protein